MWMIVIFSMCMTGKNSVDKLYFLAILSRFGCSKLNIPFTMDICVCTRTTAGSPLYLPTGQRTIRFVRDTLHSNKLNLGAPIGMTRMPTMMMTMLVGLGYVTSNPSNMFESETHGLMRAGPLTQIESYMYMYRVEFHLCG